MGVGEPQWPGTAGAWQAWDGWELLQELQVPDDSTARMGSGKERTHCTCAAVLAVVRSCSLAPTSTPPISHILAPEPRWSHTAQGTPRCCSFPSASLRTVRRRRCCAVPDHIRFCDLQRFPFASQPNPGACACWSWVCSCCGESPHHGFCHTYITYPSRPPPAPPSRSSPPGFGSL